MQKTLTASMLIAAASATYSSGGCPNVAPIAIDKAAFQGQWYEIQRDKIFPFEMGQECTTHEYKLQDNGDLKFRFRGWFW